MSNTSLSVAMSVTRRGTTSQVLVLLIDGQLLQEGCGQYEQLYVGAVQHFYQVHNGALHQEW